MKNIIVKYRRLSILLLLVLFINSACDSRKYRNLIDKSVKTEESRRKEKDSLNTITKEQSNNITNENKKVVITHYAQIKTSMGDITLGLFGEDTPETVANFIGLAKMNYYNGVLFHRVAKNFLIQTGDRTTLFQHKRAEWGLGGESFYGGEIEDEINPQTASYAMGYIKGTVAMANKGSNTNTSQFFICLEDAVKLKHQWTIFGKVIKGMEVVENISNVKVEKNVRAENDGIPLKPIRIYSVTIDLVKAPRIR